MPRFRCSSVAPLSTTIDRSDPSTAPTMIACHAPAVGNADDRPGISVPPCVHSVFQPLVSAGPQCDRSTAPMPGHRDPPRARNPAHSARDTISTHGDLSLQCLPQSPSSPASSAPRCGSAHLWRSCSRFRTNDVRVARHSARHSLRLARASHCINERFRDPVSELCPLLWCSPIAPELWLWCPYSAT